MVSCGPEPMQDSITQKDTAYLFDALGMSVQLPWDPAVSSPDRYLERHGGGLADTELSPPGRECARRRLFCPVFAE